MRNQSSRTRYKSDAVSTTTTATILFGASLIRAANARWQRHRFVAGLLASGVDQAEAQQSLLEVQRAGLVP